MLRWSSCALAAPSGNFQTFQSVYQGPAKSGNRRVKVCALRWSSCVLGAPSPVV